jgi:hypothetical protein
LKTPKPKCAKAYWVLYPFGTKEKEAYTSEILDTLKNAKLLVVEGTVYPLLTRA